MKAGVEDVAVEGKGSRGEGVLLAGPWLGGGGGKPCLGPQPGQPAPGADPPWAQGALDSEYSPDAPLFWSPKVTYVTLRWAFRRMLRHRIRNKGEGGAWRCRGGGMGMEAPGGKAPVSHPRTNLGWGFDAGKNFFGAGGRLMRSSHWELLFLH